MTHGLRIACTAVLCGVVVWVRIPLRAQTGQNVLRERLTAVVLLDATRSTADAMAPFVWDGTRDQMGRPSLLSGSRLPHRPSDLYLAGIRDGLVRHIVPGDRICFGSIGRRIRLCDSFAVDAAGMIRAARVVLDVPDAERYGPSPLWDAIDQAVGALAGEPGRRAIVLVSDGTSTGNRHSLDDVIRRAVESAVSVSVIHEMPRIVGLGARLDDNSANPWTLAINPFSGGPGSLMKRLSEATGGGYFVDDTVGRFHKREDGRYVPDPASSRARTLVKMFELVLAGIRR